MIRSGPKPVTEQDIPEQYEPSLVDELRVPLPDWKDPGGAGRAEDCIIRSID